MEAEDIRDHCLLKPGVSESFPFDAETLVYKVGGKMFLLIPLEKRPFSFSAKNLPAHNDDLREKYHQITGAWHMNKTHWNSVTCEGLKKELVLKLIDDSYDLVFRSLTKKMQEDIRKEAEN